MSRGRCSSSRDRAESASYSVPGGVLSLSGKALKEFLRSVLDKGTPFRFRAFGFSMYPFIRDGDVVTVSPMPAGRPGLGDVVAFVHPETEKLILHRVVCSLPSGYVIRGDNVPEPDGFVLRENVCGLVSLVERDGRSKTLGLGPERPIIAVLSRHGLLRVLFPINYPRRLASSVLRRSQGISACRRINKVLRSVPPIVEADEKDLGIVYAALNPSGSHRQVQPNPMTTSYVAKNGSDIMGFVQLVRHPEEHFPYVGLWIFGLIVRLRYRGMGIGEALVGRVIAKAREEGGKELLLLVNSNNRAAIALYRKLGFAPAVVPTLEERLVEESRITGVRRVTMRRPLQ